MQDLGLPAALEGPPPRSTTALQRAPKRRRLAGGSSSDGGSNWEPEAPASCAQRVRAGRQAKRALPAAQDTEATANAVLRNRVAQSQYLRRKKVVTPLSRSHLILPGL